MRYEGVSARPTTIPLAEVRESVSGQPISAAGQRRHPQVFERMSSLPLKADQRTFMSTRPNANCEHRGFTP
jgi:hypothetical protein